MATNNYKINDLFQPGEFQFNACVGKNGGPYTSHAYSIGYFNAARILVEAIIVDSAEIDIAIYPIVYCYRHSIELGLKHLADLLPKIWDDTPQVKNTHLLIDNWRTVKSYLSRDQAFNKNGNDIAYVEKVLDDILLFDPKAEVFRFSKDKSGQFHLQDSAHINVIVFRNVMEAIRSIFEGWFTMGSVMLDFKQEVNEASV